MESRSLQLFPTLVKQFREVITEKERLEIIEILKKHNFSLPNPPKTLPKPARNFPETSLNPSKIKKNTLK